MAKAPENLIMSTYAQLSLSNWHVLADLIRQNTRSSKQLNQEQENDDEADKRDSVLELEQINDAIDGPMQAFFQDKMRAYASLAHIRMALNLENDDTLKEDLLDSALPKIYDKKQLEKIDADTLTDIGSKLDQLTETHNLQWQQHFSDWASLISQKLNSSGLELSMLEIAEMQTPEPISELLQHYLALNIDKPKLKKGDMNYQHYLTLKADLAIHSALSRQHKSHEQKDINSYLKQLKKDLDVIGKAEQQLIHLQQQETAALLSPLKL